MTSRPCWTRPSCVALVAFLGTVAFARYVERRARDDERVSAVLLVVGAVSCCSPAWGCVRMPDLFSRHAGRDQGVHPRRGLPGAGGWRSTSSDLAVTTRAVLVIAFVFLTAPVAAHMIARAAYAVGAPLWEGTITDELRAATPPAAARAAPARRGSGPEG